MDGRSSTESDVETRSSSSYLQSVHSAAIPSELENSINIIFFSICFYRWPILS